MTKIVTKISQDSAVTQTMLGVVSYIPPHSKFIAVYTLAENYENQFKYFEAISEEDKVSFVGIHCSPPAASAFKYVSLVRQIGEFTRCMFAVFCRFVSRDSNLLSQFHYLLHMVLSVL